MAYSSAVENDLDFNKFFSDLQVNFYELYKKAQDNCYLICIPCVSAIQNVEVTAELIESHLFRKSPYFQGQYVSIDKAGSRTIEIEDDFIHSVQGFSSPVKAQILAEERGYNSQFQPYRILVIDCIIAENYKKVKHKDLLQQSVLSVDLESVGNSYESCLDYINFLPEKDKFLKYMDEQVEQFCMRYMVLEDYLNETSIKLQNIFTLCVTHRLASHEKEKHGRPRQVLEAATEMYIAYHTHSKIYPVIARCYSKEDTAVSLRIETMRDVTLDELDIRKELQCPLPKAICALQQMKDLRTPLEKLFAIKSSLDLISSEVDEFRESCANFLQPKTKNLFLASDDVLPLLVSVIIQCNGLHAMTDIYYMENFHWMSTKDDLAFYLTTFRAAVSYIRNAKYPAPDKHELGLYSLTSEVNNLHFDKKDLSKVSPRRKELVSSALPVASSSLLALSSSTTKDVKQKSREKSQSTAGSDCSKTESVSLLTPEIIPLPGEESQQNNLGDFLKVLQENSLGWSYGSQL